jgi:hypothetical protein
VQNPVHICDVLLTGAILQEAANNEVATENEQLKAENNSMAAMKVLLHSSYYAQPCFCVAAVLNALSPSNSSSSL